VDYCMLCGIGGSLLCCDACPAAYHMRCVGESAKAIPEGEWLCAECCIGGRGGRQTSGTTRSQSKELRTGNP
jgi:PHD-finger